MPPIPPPIPATDPLVLWINALAGACGPTVHALVEQVVQDTWGVAPGTEEHAFLRRLERIEWIRKALFPRFAEWAISVWPIEDSPQAETVQSLHRQLRQAWPKATKDDQKERCTSLRLEACTRFLEYFLDQLKLGRISLREDPAQLRAYLRQFFFGPKSEAAYVKLLCRQLGRGADAVEPDPEQPDLDTNVDAVPDDGTIEPTMLEAFQTFLANLPESQGRPRIALEEFNDYLHWSVKFHAADDARFELSAHAFAFARVGGPNSAPNAVAGATAERVRTARLAFAFFGFFHPALPQIRDELRAGRATHRRAPFDFDLWLVMALAMRKFSGLPDSEAQAKKLYNDATTNYLRAAEQQLAAWQEAQPDNPNPRMLLQILKGKP